MGAVAAMENDVGVEVVGRPDHLKIESGAA
jgi:hypothetical protein